METLTRWKIKTLSTNPNEIWQIKVADVIPNYNIRVNFPYKVLQFRQILSQKQKQKRQKQYTNKHSLLAMFMNTYHNNNNNRKKSISTFKPQHLIIPYNRNKFVK